VEAMLSAPHTAKGRLQRHALAALRRHETDGELPTSVRFLFYELEQAGILSKNVHERSDGKKGRRPDQDLIDAVKHLREAGAVPWDWIADDTRTLHRLDAGDTLLEELDAILDNLPVNPWAGELLPVLLTESRTMGGVFARGVAAEYGVPVGSTNGQAGGFLVTDIAPFLRARPDTHVLYVGDLDHAGADIEANTRRVLERHVGRSFEWERVAITRRQAAGLRRRGLTPIVKRDGRYKDKRTHEAWEADLGQGSITAILRRRLEDLLPEPLEDVHERAEAERAAVRDALGLR
jgi:hypothetical protein